MLGKLRVKLSTYFDQEKIRQLVTWFGVEPALNSAPADAVFAKLIELKLLDSPPGDITHLYEFLVESKHLVMVKLCNEYLEHQRRAKAQQQPQPQPTKLQLQSDLLNAGSMKIPVRAAVAKHPVTHAQEVTDKKRGVRILCIDGAGARGVITCQYLKTLEEHLGCELYEYFDLICGTSTGGLLAIAISGLRMSADECLELHSKYCAALYSDQSGSALDTLLDPIFESSVLDDIPYPRAFSVSMERRADPFLFRTYSVEDGDTGIHKGASWAMLKTVLRASTAMDSKPLNWNSKVLQDASHQLSNPTKAAIIEAGRLWPTAKIDVVVSLGTGKESKNGGALGSPASRKSLSRVPPTAEEIHLEVVPMLKNSIYVRLQCDLEYASYPMEFVDSKLSKQLVELASETIMAMKRQIDRIPKPELIIN